MKAHRSASLAWIALCLTAAATEAAPTTNPALPIAGVTFKWLADEQGRVRPSLHANNADVAATAAVIVNVLSGNGEPIRLEANYDQVGPGYDMAFWGSATLKTPAGSTFEITDKWEPNRAEIRIERTITVRTVAPSDQAFGSDVEFSVPNVKSLADADVFIPGLWYATSAHTPPSGLITDVGQRDFILREDRMALPLVSVRDRVSGTTLTLTHLNPDGATIVGDDNLARVIDARLTFGSLGIRRDGNLRIVFRYPGSEGEQTSIFGFKPDRRTAERFHPMTVGATQKYSLALRLDTAKNFPEQMRSAWRSAYDEAKPLIVPVDAPALLNASINVLDRFFFKKADVAGIPFRAHLPKGDVDDESLQMGFVGQQLPNASYLIDEGIRTKQRELVAKGEAICDFWVKNSFSDKGVPRTWFDVAPAPHFRDYPTFLRVVTDGTSGLLRAWQIERTAKTTKPAWLGFCRRVGDWLLKIQNADGSFYRSWNFDGSAASKSLTSTLHPVRLLVDLSAATGDIKYRKAAIRAADFALLQNTTGATYVGGTPDNPDVLDKEAGWIAFDSYLALYDVTRDKKYLDAAAAAATFTETWIYAWNVPLPVDAKDADLSVPRVNTFVGSNLIATGHSGVDQFLAYASFSYARLAIYTSDSHFADIARLLQHNSAQFVDINHSLHYATPGLLVEAFSLSVNRGHSVGTWLPWCTSAIVEPLARLRETFGVLDIDAVFALDEKERTRLNEAFAQSRGFHP